MVKREIAKAKVGRGRRETIYIVPRRKYTTHDREGSSITEEEEEDEEDDDDDEEEEEEEEAGKGVGIVGVLKISEYLQRNKARRVMVVVITHGRTKSRANSRDVGCNAQNGHQNLT
ncbi:hypothetical protein M0802_000135 [Mischocyttarus mexicanus]|nr:hypothetical protein M0802_000135 [Mischocyttarus mexicanus]